MIAKLEQLKDAGQDFEWYPTTQEMIDVIARHTGKAESILDIGAGDGRVLTGLVAARKLIDLRGEKDEYRRQAILDFEGPVLYAIEKAGLHIEAMPARVAMVGTDFESQTLIDKQVDVIFSNPPYSVFEPWACKIIKEAYCNDLFLILPSRWNDSKAIKSALEHRGATAKVIWSGDFLNAERQARATVDIIKVNLSKVADYYQNREKKDPFDAWFTETYPAVANMKENQKHETPKQRIGELTKGQNLVERLTELYQLELAKMNADYKALCEINPSVFKTVGVSAKQVRDSLQQAIEGLKNLYWKELFDHLDKITQRLTNKSRQSFLEKIGRAVHVDFTHENVYAVVLWVLKNANEYMDGQLCELFKDLSQPAHVTNYKSNQRTWAENHWRFMDQNPTHYALDYRIITEQRQGIHDGGWNSYDYPDNLHKRCHEMLQDIITIANNLGYACSDVTTGREWESGKPQIFKLSSGQVLMRAKAFKNGNLHMQFHQGFIKALNIEASRLLGWITTPQEAHDEMGIDIITAQRHFNTNLRFTGSDCKRLTA